MSVFAEIESCSPEKINIDSHLFRSVTLPNLPSSHDSFIGDDHELIDIRQGEGGIQLRTQQHGVSPLSCVI